MGYYLELPFLLLILVCTVVDKSAAACSGDTAGVIKDGSTCSELVTEATKSECYNATTETLCCASCAAVATNVAGCNYGDQISCFSFMCPGLTDPSVCCATCTTATTAPTAAPTTATTTNAITTTTTSTTTATTTAAIVTTTDTAAIVTTTDAAASTTAAATTISSAAATATPGSDTAQEDDNDDLNEGAIIGGVLGGIGFALLILVVVYVGMKLYKRSKQKVKPTHGNLPPKPDLFSQPSRLDLYSTPTMIVIDTSGTYVDENERHPPPQIPPVKANVHGDINGPTYDTWPKDRDGPKRLASELSAVNEKGGMKSETKAGTANGHVFKTNITKPVIHANGNANGNLKIEDINEGDVAHDQIVDSDPQLRLKQRMETAEANNVKFSYPNYDM